MSEIIEDNVDCEDVGGFVTVEVIRDGKNGPQVLERRVAHNLIVTQGKGQIWRLVTGLQTNLFNFFQIGTSSQAAAVGQVALTSPITGTVNSADTKSLLSGTRTMEWVISYPSGGGSKSATNIQEVMLLNKTTASGHSAMMRAVFTAVNKTTADKLKITYNARIT